jgi:hypothetical protein
MERRADFVFNVSLGAAMVLAGQLIFDGADWVGGSHWWEIVSALGTAAAAAIALWLADKERRAREQGRRFEAAMIKQIVHDELVDLLNFLSGLPSIFQRMIDPDVPERAKQRTWERIQREAAAVSLDVLRSERPNLRQLPQGEAEAIARVLGGLPKLLSFVKRIPWDGASTPNFWDFCDEELMRIERLGKEVALVLGTENQDFRVCALIGSHERLRQRVTELQMRAHLEDVDANA